MPYKLNLCTLLLFFYGLFLFGQENAFLRGRLLDAQTQEPIPFATVRVKGYAAGRDLQ